jgi:hypothetical protein
LHTQDKINTALSLLSEVFENDQQWQELSITAKELFAGALLTAHELTRRE